VNDASQAHVGPKEQSSHRRRCIAGVILAASFFAAGGVRLYNIDAAKLYFNPTRQYYSFCIARHFYFEGTDSVPAWQRNIAAINKEALDDKEPPITEYLVSLIWRACGSENHWAPSALSSLFWLVGGVFVFLIAKKYTSAVAAAIATAFYLLCPFGIVMSRSFQPESLMTMMFGAGIYTIFNYYEKPSTKRLFITALVSGVAVLVKVNIVFPIWCAFVAGGFYKQGFRKTFFSKQQLLFILVGIMPGFIYYFYRTLTTEIMQMAVETIFVPQLLWDSFFWVGWLRQIGFVVGFVPIVAAVFGIFLVRAKTAKSILTGLVVGYLVYAMIFSYSTPTQDYYHIQVLPVAALALSPAIAFFVNQLTQKESRGRLPAVIIFLLLLAAFLVALVSIKKSVFRSENKYTKFYLNSLYKSFGLKPEFLSQIGGDAADFIAKAEEIGDAVNHSERTITLGLTVPLWYYGQYAGYRWPFSKHWPFPDHIGSIGTGARWSEYRGLSAAELLKEHFSRFSPEYFVVGSLAEFEKQEGLKEFFYGRFRVLAKGKKHLIFDLTEPKQ